MRTCAWAGNFIVPAAGRGCSRPGQQLARFTEVKPNRVKPGWTVYLGEESDYNDEQARLAAVQRLLDDQRLRRRPDRRGKGPQDRRSARGLSERP